MSTIDAHPNDLAAVVRAEFGISRQAISVYLRALEDEGVLTSRGNTRGRRYRRANRSVELAIEGLSEHEAYREHVQPLLDGLPENVLRILEYGVTEIVNNAIDHSGSATVSIDSRRTAKIVQVTVRDSGVGIFRKIQTECKLEDVRFAVFELTKGKLTTDPTRHTGEGIFFTSRMFDEFSIMSYDLFLGHMRDGDDWLLHDPGEPRTETVAGTMVTMAISPASTHTSTEVFEKYAVDQDDYAFNKTHVVVELAKTGEDSFVSRSQAKRIVARLEKFKEVCLDFTDVAEIGPAFSDEIFRVFATRYPETHLIPISMNEQVTKMVRRASTS
jgi:anti-sigma regulatory factor (Ser/Thr protein kinase)